MERLDRLVEEKREAILRDLDEGHPEEHIIEDLSFDEDISVDFATEIVVRVKLGL